MIVWGGIGGIAFLLNRTYAISSVSTNDSEKMKGDVKDGVVVVPYCERSIIRDRLVRQEE